MAVKNNMSHELEASVSAHIDVYMSVSVYALSSLCHRLFPLTWLIVRISRVLFQRCPGPLFSDHHEKPQAECGAEYARNGGGADRKAVEPRL